jgi:DNA mismatch repair protein MutL
MTRIRVLPPDVRGKIAAGEVITRPASVVKELIENSIDAQASRIDIEVKNGGKDKCLVNDDGQGMSREDAQLAIERYATSKILSIGDIERISTFGFRGEALASIAHVSNFEMETSDGHEGTRLLVEGGTVKGLYDSERPRGTRIKVSNLFYNLPARRKFLKSLTWERRLIIELVKTYAVVHPRVVFSLLDEGKVVFSLLGTDSMYDRVKALLPRSITDQLVVIDFTVGDIRITGLLSRPDLAVAHRFSHIFVNSRPVKYPRIYHTIMETYQNPKSGPAFALNIQVEPHLVDANVHPAKTEVKFKDERYIADLLMQVIKREIFKKSVAVDNEDKQPHDFGKLTGTKYFVQDTVLPYDEENVPPAHDSDEFWQLHGTYILAQTKSGLIIVDQHVAHERIIYEAVMTGRVQSQRLLFPVTIELTPEEHEVYQRTKDALQDMGIEFKEFSSNTVIIDSVPADFRIDREEIAGIFGELLTLGDLVGERARIARVVACRGAIKTGQKLSVLQMQSLIDRLFATENPYTCPHGRPIVIKLTLEELAHKFGRS